VRVTQPTEVAPAGPSTTAQRRRGNRRTLDTPRALD